MGGTVFEQLLWAPIASILILVQTGIWFCLWNYNIEITRFGFNYDRKSYCRLNVTCKRIHAVSFSFLSGVLADEQYWRTITCTFTHLNVLHLVFNMSALFMYGLALERQVSETIGNLFWPVG